MKTLRNFKYLVFVITLLDTGQLVAQQPWKLMLRFYQASGKVKTITDETQTRCNNRYFLTGKTVTRFNQVGYVTDQTTYDVTGDVLFSEHYTYSPKNKLLREEKRTGDSLWLAMDYKYDSNDSLVAKIDVTPGKKPYEQTRFTYKNQREVEMVYFNANGTEKSRTHYLYDSAHHLLESTRIRSGDTLVEKDCYSPSGELSLEIRWDNSQLRDSTVFTFDEQGNKILGMVYGKNHRLQEKTIYSRSQPNRPYNRQVYDGQGYYKGWTDYEYDSAGNLARYQDYPGELYDYRYKNYTQGNWTVQYKMAGKIVGKIIYRKTEYW